MSRTLGMDPRAGPAPAMESAARGTVYVVDAHNYLYRAFFALPPLSTRGGLPTGAIRGLCQMLLKIERERRPTHLVAVLDAPGRTFRDDLHAEYKAQRAAMPAELATQIALVPRVLDAFGIATLEIPGVEADDVIATVARRSVERGLNVVICSSDKDLMQLVGDRVTLLDGVRDRLLGPDDVRDRWGVAPEQVGDLLALTGDAADNVPGVPGIGPKTAAALLREHGSLAGLLANLDQIKGKRGEALRAARAQVHLARTLVTLKDDVVLPVDLDGLWRRPPDQAKLARLFEELEFHHLASQVERDLGSLALLDPAAAARAERPVQCELAAPTSLSAPEPTTPGITKVRDLAGLRTWVASARAAGAFGVVLSCDGLDATRARPLAFAFALPDGRRTVIPTGDGPDLGRVDLGRGWALTEEQIVAELAPILGDPGVVKYVYDGKFMDVVLRTRGACLVGVASDALLAAYLIDPARTDHALERLAGSAGLTARTASARRTGGGHSVQAPAELWRDEAEEALCDEAAAVLALAPLQTAELRAQGLETLYREVELPLARVLAGMETRGILVDVAHLRALAQEAARAIDDLTREIYALSGTTFNIASPKQLQSVLFDKLGLPVTRKTKTGPSTDADVLESLATLHLVPAKILEHRSLTKLKGTYLDALPALINPRTGRLHTTFRQAVAATGRLSSSDPNLQNIPVRSPLGKRIRDAFIAPPGRVLMSADYSQIELRVLAHFSGDPAFVAAFRDGEDIHRRTAAEIFDIAPEAVGDEQRRIAKAINFGLVFGQTDFGLAQALGIGRGAARAYIERYFARYAGVRAYMDSVVARAYETGEVTTLLGRRRKVPELKAARAQLRAHGERIARNTPIQGSAADLLKLAMLRVDAALEALNRSRAPERRIDLLLTVHDELVFELPHEDAVSVAQRIRDEMEGVFTLKVPLRVDVVWGPTWGAGGVNG